MAHEWKIRSMDEADSQEAVKAAQRGNVNVAVWLGQAIRAYVATERGNAVPAHDMAGPQQETDQDRLIAMAALDGKPQWFSRRVYRLLGETIGAEPPKPPKRLSERRTETARLAAPQPVEPNGGNGLASSTIEDGIPIVGTIGAGGIVTPTPT